MQLYLDQARAGYHTPPRDRLVAALAAAGFVALLGAMLLFGLTINAIRRSEPSPLVLLNITPPSPPPPPHEQPLHRQAQLARHAAAPRNLRNKPTPIVAPPPPMIAPPPILAAKAPGTGAAVSAGASDRAGPGTGAGGVGNGTGGGGNGGDGDETPPRQVKGKLKMSDLPRELQDAAAQRMLLVGVRYSVEADGSVGACVVTQSSGHRDLDALTCDLIRVRFRYKPSRDGAGHPVRSIVEDTHGWSIEREEEPAR